VTTPTPNSPFSDSKRQTPEQQRVEGSLRESEARFREIAETIQDIFCVADAKQRKVLYVNPAYEKISGRSREKLFQNYKDWMEVVHPDDRQRVAESFHSKTMEGKFDEEFRMVRPDGTMAWIRGRVYPVISVNHDVEHVIGVAQDITDRKLAEELAQSHARAMEEQAQLLELANDAVIARDAQSRVLFWNKGAETLYGWTAAEAQGKNLHELLGTPPDSVNEFRAALLERGEWLGELHHKTRAGEEVVVQSRQVLQRDARGEVERILEINRDITEQKRAEEELRRTEDRLAMAQESGGVGLWDWDVISDTTTCSPKYLGLFGLPEASPAVSSETWLNRIHPEDRERVKVTLFGDLAGGQIREIEYRVLWPDGSVHWLVSKATGVSDVSDSERMIARITGVVYDITERKQAETELLETKQHLEQLVAQRTAALQELSGRLLRMQDEERRRIARELHDSMGQELSVMKMLLESALQRGLPDPENERSVAESLRMAENVLKEVRSLSYLLHPPLLDEMGLVPALHWYVEGLSQRSGLQISLLLDPPEFGRLAPELETTVFRIVQESLTNVYKHSQSPTATVRLEQSGSQVRVRVEDAGKGISSDKLANLSTTIGVGIGGMRERVRQFGGDVRISSNSNGTTVEVVFPLRRTGEAHESSRLRSTA
jgi:PAS domain S-box-containing protein